mmetsp:Transcript_32301/g.54456  ORF Transcript_32301/g.54456 Transcript_32301/m.54456 type:complete len:560 (-) Transcript_32301:949-2628(-)
MSYLTSLKDFDVDSSSGEEEEDVILLNAIKNARSDTSNEGSNKRPKHEHNVAINASDIKWSPKMNEILRQGVLIHGESNWPAVATFVQLRLKNLQALQQQQAPPQTSVGPILVGLHPLASVDKLTGVCSGSGSGSAAPAAIPAAAEEEEDQEENAADTQTTASSTTVTTKAGKDATRINSNSGADTVVDSSTTGVHDTAPGVLDTASFSIADCATQWAVLKATSNMSGTVDTDTSMRVMSMGVNVVANGFTASDKDNLPFSALLVSEGVPVGGIYHPDTNVIVEGNNSGGTGSAGAVDREWTKEEMMMMHGMVQDYNEESKMMLEMHKQGGYQQLMQARATKINWQALARSMGRRYQDVYQKFNSLRSEGLKHGSFTEAEDSYIIQRVMMWNCANQVRSDGSPVEPNPAEHFRNPSRPGLWVALERELNRKDKRISERWRNVLSKRIPAAITTAAAVTAGAAVGDDVAAASASERNNMTSHSSNGVHGSFELSADGTLVPVSTSMKSGPTKWTPEMDAQLVALVAQYPRDWVMVSKHMGFDSTTSSCRKRWKRLEAKNQ